jgi:hypothetical protein
VFPGLYSAEFWHYDSRLLRRWEPDPITYDWQSPYACFNNDPIGYADPLGLEGQGGKKGTSTNPKYPASDGWNQYSCAGCSGGTSYSKSSGLDGNTNYKAPVATPKTNLAPTNAINFAVNDAIKHNQMVANLTLINGSPSPKEPAWYEYFDNQQGKTSKMWLQGDGDNANWIKGGTQGYVTGNGPAHGAGIKSNDNTYLEFMNFDFLPGATAGGTPNKNNKSTNVLNALVGSAEVAEAVESNVSYFDISTASDNDKKASHQAASLHKKSDYRFVTYVAKYDFTAVHTWINGVRYDSVIYKKVKMHESEFLKKGYVKQLNIVGKYNGN